MKEAEIVSSTEHLFKETFYSLVTKLKGAMDAQQPQDKSNKGDGPVT